MSLKRVAATAALGLPLVSCLATAGAGRPAVERFDVNAPLPATQRLYRLQVEGATGDGGLRLTLRLVPDRGYQIETNDPFGRRLWALRFVDGAGLVVDHRQRTFCRYGETVPLPEAALAALPLASLARVLLGVSPLPFADEKARPIDDSGVLAGGEYSDPDGGRWRLRWTGGALSSWTYFAAGEERPLIWWSRAIGRTGGVLSHRDGTQLRWTESVSEPLVGELPEAPVGADYVECAL